MKALIIMLWGLWDRIYYLFNRMHYVSKGENLFRIIKKKYKGPPLQTSDGKWIKEGDEIVKIHIYNYGLAKKFSATRENFQLALSLRKEIVFSLKGLSKHMYSSPQFSKVTGIVGTSMLNRGANRLGFSVYDVQQSFYYLTKHYLYKFIYVVVHPEGFQYLRKHGQKLETKHMVMSTQQLFSTYLQRDEV